MQNVEFDRKSFKLGSPSPRLAFRFSVYPCRSRDTCAAYTCAIMLQMSKEYGDSKNNFIKSVGLIK